MTPELPGDARAVVITASNRASAGVYEDRSGQFLVDGLSVLGFAVEPSIVLPDDVERLTAAIREAVASGAEVVLTTGGTGLSPTDVTPEATRAVLEREAPGIAGAKRTPDLVPLCHPIALHGVTVDLEVTDDAVEITATARTADRTGVEMEALTSVAVAGLTLIDMVKAVDPRAAITDVRLLRKSGGKSGVWER